MTSTETRHKMIVMPLFHYKSNLNFRFWQINLLFVNRELSSFLLLISSQLSKWFMEKEEKLWKKGKIQFNFRSNKRADNIQCLYNSINLMKTVFWLLINIWITCFRTIRKYHEVLSNAKNKIVDVHCTLTNMYYYVLK